MSRFIATVSQVNRRIALTFRNDKALQGLFVRGEISNFVWHHKSGHIYFTLKDSEAAIKCVMFSLETENLAFRPENGMSIVAGGYIGVYERDGAYQLYVNAIEKGEEKKPEEQPGQYEQFLLLKEKLSKEGVFSNRRPLPQYPERINLITSKDGAVLSDIITSLERRYPFVEVALFPALMQGQAAPASVMNALKAAGNTEADIIIIARGGGSAEDLSAFNDEALARAIHACAVPVVSAIGHETDFTIADFAADLRAPTPTAAAELASPDLSGLAGMLDAILIQLQKRVLRIYESRRRELESAWELIGALNPERVFRRGFAAVFKDGKVLKSIKDVNAGEELNVRMADGSLTVAVKERT